jgi:excinuclease ABC subunit C
VEIRTPQRGSKREMMDLVNRNARLCFLQRFRASGLTTASIAKEVEEVLDLERPPRRIECFDISNLQGSDVVASMVVWEDGRMKKSDYRRFIIRSLSGMPDDFQSMREVVTRRYKRAQEEGLSMPDLVLIDGGVGQLHAAQSALDSLNVVDQPLASIAKREEIIYIAGREDDPIVLERRSPVLRLIQQIRDESHRFAINFHRERRGRRHLSTELAGITGIGLRTSQKLLSHFGSLAKIREASIEDLQAVATRPQAESIWHYFHE